jgi:hypothetical protein
MDCSCSSLGKVYTKIEYFGGANFATTVPQLVFRAHYWSGFRRRMDLHPTVLKSRSIAMRNALMNADPKAIKSDTPTYIEPGIGIKALTHLFSPRIISISTFRVSDTVSRPNLNHVD